MIYLQLFWEFFKVGLFSVGGGMATLPFLAHMGDATGWFTQSQLMNMLAISESTPGPVGINMATYVGFTTAGVPGAIVSTVGEVTPSIIVILMIAALLQQFRQSKYVQFAFYGLRPTSTGLIGAACLGVILETLVNFAALSSEGVDWIGLFNWRGLALAGALLVFTTWVKPTKKWHPIVFIVISAAVGVAFRFGGA
ncbi:chromate transporter [Oscillibacter sp.]|uniref:chromate transporter n=1 Tax=Oscillibacter sp. TaxID=1945593 RepID=UPI00289C4C90|nr:chromate transporter [Oscillibacter sp.]